MELYVSWIKQSGTLWMKWLRIKGPFQSKCHRCGLKNKLIPPLPIQLSLVWKFNLSHLNVANLSFHQSHRSQLKLNLWWFSEYFHFQLFEEEGKRGGWLVVGIYRRNLFEASFIHIWHGANWATSTSHRHHHHPIIIIIIKDILLLQMKKPLNFLSPGLKGISCKGLIF